MRKKKALPPSYRRKPKRLILGRLILVSTVTAGVCLLTGTLVVLVALIMDVSTKPKQITLGLALLGMGAVSLLLRILFRWTQRRVVDRRPSRRAGASARVSNTNKERSRALHRPPTQRSGSVLVLTLVIVTLLGGLLLQTQIAVRGSFNRAQSALRETRLRIAAEEGVREALRRLANDTDLETDHLNEEWAKPLPDRRCVGNQHLHPGAR